MWHHLFSNPSLVSNSPPEMHGYFQAFLFQECWLSKPPCFLLVSATTASLSTSGCGEKVLFHSQHLQSFCQLPQSPDFTQGVPASPTRCCISAHVIPCEVVGLALHGHTSFVQAQTSPQALQGCTQVLSSLVVES